MFKGLQFLTLQILAWFLLTSKLEENKLLFIHFPQYPHTYT
jgi:hypothetical protein